MTDIYVGLWGPSRSGKTAYLCALKIIEDVRMTPLNTWAHTFMHDHATPFSEGKFPQATNAIVEYHFSVSVPPSPQLHYGLNAALFIVDSDGRILDQDSTTFNDDGYRTVLSAHFAQADGLLYIYDPLSHDNLVYLESLVKVMTPPTRAGARAAKFEQFIAVCVAKFDDPRVFTQARAASFVPEGVAPSIPQNQEEYFMRTADPAVVAEIRKHFQEERTRYFVTSSVGFRRNAEGKVDPSDYANVTIIKGEPRFKEGKGKITPINLLEPLIWLERRITNRYHSDPDWRKEEKAQAKQENPQAEPE